jgi:hypothetical protein
MYHIQDHNQTVYHTGMLIGSDPKLCTVAAIEDTPMMLTDEQIDEIAKSGMADERKNFDESWILDQKSHGSCCGHGCAGALMKARYRRNLGKELLSGAYVYSKINGGQDRGALLEDGMAELSSKGACKLSTVGWDAIYPNRYKPEADVEASNYKGFELYKAGTLQGLWTGLALKFDAVIAVHVGNSFMHLDQQGISGIDGGPGNHCIHADGIRWAGKRVANSVNSWGVSFGDKGRSALTNEHFRQTFQYHTFFLLRSTSDNSTPVPQV